MVEKLLIALVCVLANAFFVAAEFALVKVRGTQLQAKARQGDVRAARALRLVERLDEYLSASQLGITLASLALGWLGEPALAALLSPVFSALGMRSEALLHGVSFTLAFVCITGLHIVAGEQAPKLLAIQKAEAVALFCAGPLRVFYLLTWPFLWVLNEASLRVLRLFRLPVLQHAEGALSAEEIRLIVAEGELETRQRQLLERVLAGTGRPVRAVMVPRVDLVTVSLLDDPGTVVERLRVEGYSRIPVTTGHKADEVVGYIYLKDVFVGNGLPKGGLRALRRDILYVPENRTVGDVLGDMQRTRIPIAVVVDEYGGTAGLVTLEDIVEEIVGELQDELDAEAPRIARQPDESILVEGTVPLKELEPLGVLIASKDPGELLAGRLLAQLGRLARPGDIVELADEWEATVEDVRSRRVGRVRLRRRGVAEQSADSTR